MSELFKSDFFTISLSETPSVKGHLTVKNSKPLADCNDKETSLFFAASSQCATALFELVGAQGTNILINETNDSLTGDIIARSQDDGLDFLWQPTRGDPIALDGVAKSIKDEIDLLVWKKDNPDSDALSSQSSQPEIIKDDDVSQTGEKKVNYMLKKLHRTP